MIQGVHLMTKNRALIQFRLQSLDLFLRQFQKGLAQRLILTFVASCHLNPSLLPAFP